MNDKPWRRNEPDSPCQNICVVHPGARICVGCYRTIEEISRWSSMSTGERREIMAILPDRAPELRAPQNRASRRKRQTKDV